MIKKTQKKVFSLLRPFTRRKTKWKKNPKEKRTKGNTKGKKSFPFPFKYKTKGGKLIGRGGYGCIFSPPLKCRGKSVSSNRSTRYVSKLLDKESAHKEFRTIEKIKNMLKTIPNFANYFLLDDFTICTPDKLSPEDVVNFQECSTLLPEENKSNYPDSKEITHYLEYVNNPDFLAAHRVITMPYGGTEVNDFLKSPVVAQNYSLFYKLHRHLVELFFNGIVPMNRDNHVYHNDLKASNILVLMEQRQTKEPPEKSSSMKTRIIDWGVTFVYRPVNVQSSPSVPRSVENARPPLLFARMEGPIPDQMRHSILEFNRPFSVVLFSKRFRKTVDKEFASFVSRRLPTKHFVLSFLREMLKEKKGHFPLIHRILMMMQKKERMLFTEDMALNIIADYLSVLIDKYPHSLYHYINHVYIHLVDFTGFLSTYWPMLQHFGLIYPTGSKNETQLYLLLCDLFWEYLYKPRMEAVSLSQFRSHLDAISTVLYQLQTEK